MDNFAKKEASNTKKQLFSLTLLLVVTLLTLTGCECEHDWLDATCTQPQICTLCGETQGSARNHNWLTATCTDPMTCSRCKITQGSPLAHKWVAATCETPKSCSDCGTTQGDQLGHTYLDATCTAPATCSRCQATEGEALEHSWLEATCEEAETCEKCGATQGEKLEHDWLEATCTEPQTCTRCGSTQGEALDHDWSKATCTSAGTCQRCGEKSGSALGHKYKDATCISPKTCTRCGKESGRANGHTFPEGVTDAEKICTVCGRSVTTKYVALTFDDGPNGDLTMKLLKGLEERGVRSTFFICGYRIKYFPTLPQTVLDYGHELGLHTYNHPNLKELSADEIRKELQSTADLLPEGYNITLMRPPGGNYNNRVKSVCEEMGLSIILWSLDTRDWATNDVDEVVNKIVKNVKDGDVILMHELKNSSIEAALKAIDILQGQGYVFVTVSELAAIQEETLEPGHVYTKP